MRDIKKHVWGVTIDGLMVRAIVVRMIILNLPNR